MAEVFAGAVSEFKERDRKIIVHDGIEIGVFLIGGKFYAYQNLCRHRGGPVCQGRMIHKVEEVLGEDKTSKGLAFSEEELHIVCPWHGFEYDLRTGENAGEREIRLKKFPVKVQDGGIHVVV
jgi:nitrite reductase (NADH) small subunit